MAVTVTFAGDDKSLKAVIDKINKSLAKQEEQYKKTGEESKRSNNQTVRIANQGARLIDRLAKKNETLVQSYARQKTSDT